MIYVISKERQWHILIDDKVREIHILLWSGHSMVIIQSPLRNSTPALNQSNLCDSTTCLIISECRAATSVCASENWRENVCLMWCNSDYDFNLVAATGLQLSSYSRHARSDQLCSDLLLSATFNPLISSFYI